MDTKFYLETLEGRGLIFSEIRETADFLLPCVSVFLFLFQYLFYFKPS
jgi:hypothetical protein